MSAAQLGILPAADVPATCRRLGAVQASADSSLWFGDTLDAAALAALRQTAQRCGASDVWLTEIVPSAHRSQVYGIAYDCPPSAGNRAVSVRLQVRPTTELF